MRLILIFAFSLTFFSNAYSQELGYQIPDYDLIENEIQDSSSFYYYPDLMSRMASYDTTLTLEEYRYLYYGYLYQKEYDPNWESPDNERLLNLYKEEAFNEINYNEIIELADRSIQAFPFDLREMNILAFVYHLKGEKEMARKVGLTCRGIIDAIISSGNGKTCESGYHVISLGDEFMLLNMLNLQMSTHSGTEECDYWTVEKNESNIEGVYFNVLNLTMKSYENLINGN